MSARGRKPGPPRQVNLHRFNDRQRLALLELLSLAMICDSRTATPEGLRIKKVAQSLGFTTVAERRAHLTAVFRKISKLPRNKETFRAHLKIIARLFTGKGVREEAVAAVNDLLASDHRLADPEIQFADLMKEAFAS